MIRSLGVSPQDDTAVSDDHVKSYDRYIHKHIRYLDNQALYPLQIRVLHAGHRSPRYIATVRAYL